MLSYVPRGDLTETIISGIEVGLLVFAFPMFASSLLLYTIGKIKSPIFSLARALSFSLIFVALWEFFFFVGSFASVILGRQQILIVVTIFGAAFIYALCLVILITISSFGNPLSVLLSSVLPLLGVTFYALIMGNLKTTFLVPWLLEFIIAATILSIPNFIAFYIVEKPIKKKLGVSGYELIRGFFLEWILKNSQKIESVTDKFGEKADLPALLVALKSKKNQKLKGVIFSSCIHYGPFKETGSSALPRLLSEKIEESNKTILSVTHGACTHGQNLCSARETREAINQSIRKLKEIKFSNVATPFVRVQEKEFKMLSAVLGDTVIMISTRAPEITDDINLKVGFSALQSARKEMEERNTEFKRAFLIDSHNCILDYEESIEPNTPAAEHLLRAVEKTIQKLPSTTKTQKVRYGVSRTRFSDTYLDYGLGELGITVNIIETSWSDGKKIAVSKRYEGNHWKQRTALVIVDANNMIIGLRDKIINRLLEEKLVEEAEVLTTDTHTVNASSLQQPDYYPIGRIINHDDLIEVIIKTTKRALEDLEEVEIGTKIFKIKRVKIWTDEKLNMFFEGIDETISTLKKITIPFFASGVSLALLWLTLTI
jgi:putative membrane protein